jgi:ABC-type protease/lipase transport system fused ATPase/permease subunit
VVVVTHRATLIQHVDKMLVLDAGKAQHYGPAAEVMKAMQQKAQAAAQPVGGGAQVVAMPRAAYAAEHGSALAEREEKVS